MKLLLLSVLSVRNRPRLYAIINADLHTFKKVLR